MIQIVAEAEICAGAGMEIEKIFATGTFHEFCLN